MRGSSAASWSWGRCTWAATPWSTPTPCLEGRHGRLGPARGWAGYRPWPPAASVPDGEDLGGLARAARATGHRAGAATAAGRRRRPRGPTGVLRRRRAGRGRPVLHDRLSLLHAHRLAGCPALGHFRGTRCTRCSSSGSSTCWPFPPAWSWCWPRCFSRPAFRRLLLPRQKAGLWPVHGLAYCRKWLMTQVLDGSLGVLHGLYASVFAPAWLRLMGAQVGRGAEVFDRRGHRARPAGAGRTQLHRRWRDAGRRGAARGLDGSPPHLDRQPLVRGQRGLCRRRGAACPTTC